MTAIDLERAVEAIGWHLEYVIPTKVKLEMLGVLATL